MLAYFALQVMGHGLKGLPRDQIILATKVGRYDKAKFDFSAATVTQSVHDSLKRLQVEYIDLIQTHDIEFGDLDQVSKQSILKSASQYWCHLLGSCGLDLLSALPQFMLYSNSLHELC